MKTLSRLIIAILLCATQGAYAQNARFTTSGVIEFEKTVNMYALLKKRVDKDKGSFMAQAYEAFRKSQPQFKKLNSTLTFGDNKTLFKPKPDEGASNSFFNSPIVAQNNTIATDFNTNIFTNRKSVFEEQFLVKDTVRKINWRITGETREIAGYLCRRANALVMDSIYVVAFYTDKIPVSGGPETFAGLPGMILGVALPHDNVTWFATKVTDATVAPGNLAPPAKGKAVNNKQLRATLEGALKDWGSWASDYLKAFLL